jgi:hypothetical protein
LVSQKYARFNKDNNHELKRMHDEDIIREAMATTITIVAISAPYMVEYLICIPYLYNNTITDPIYGPEWQKAIRTKFCQLIINGTFYKVQKPLNANVVTAKWVFAVKYALNRGVKYFKAQLMARGFT